VIRLLLVRHGNTFEADQIPTQVGARTDLPLTQTGLMQAEAIARYLLSEKIRPAAIYQGPLKRQKETADRIAAPFQMPTQIVPVLTEIDYGPWEALTAESIQAKWPTEYFGWTEQSLWPEKIFKGTIPLKVIEEWIFHLSQTHRPGDTVVAVSSNGLIRYFYSLEKEKWKQLADARQMEKIKVKTGHFCDLSLIGERIVVNGWNLNPNQQVEGLGVAKPVPQ